MVTKTKAADAPASACCTPKKLRTRDIAGYGPLLRVLADDTRLQIVALLASAGSELCVCDIEAHFELSQPTISHHLRVLREADVVTAERRAHAGRARAS